MRKPALIKTLRVTTLAFVVVAIMSGWPQRLFHRTAPLKELDKRAAMPAFSLPTLEGQQWRLEDHRGRVLLVNFWATWCPPCRTETPDLVTLHNRYSPEGFSVVGITLDEDPEAVVPAFAKRYEMPYPILLPDEEFALAGAVESLPTTLLIDRNGRVAQTFLGAVDEDDIDGHIQALLREQPQAGL